MSIVQNKLLLLFCFFTTISFSLDISRLPIEARIFTSNKDWAISPNEDGSFVTRNGSKDYYRFPKDSLIFDFTTPITNKEFIAESKKYNCKNLRNIEQVFSVQSCKDFFINFLRLKKVVFVAINDPKVIERKYIDGCLPFKSSIKFVLLKQIGMEKALIKKNNFRCSFKNAKELFLIDYFGYKFSDLKSRYQSIRAKYRELGLDVDKITDHKARRFIDRRDWERALTNNTPLREVYKPSPVTWDKWEDVAFNEVISFARSGNKLHIEDLIVWNNKSLTRKFMRNSQGKLIFPNPVEHYLRTDHKKGWVVSYFNTIGSSLSAKELDKIKNYQFYWSDRYPNKWTPLVCPTRDNNPPTDRFCGKLTYVAPFNVLEYLDQLVKYVNKGLENSNSLSSRFILAVDAQRHLSMIHPFYDGNGRVSRWLMDYITIKSGLPYIIHYNMNLDYTMDEQQFLFEAKRGMLHGILIQERCWNSEEEICKQY